MLQHQYAQSTYCRQQQQQQQQQQQRCSQSTYYQSTSKANIKIRLTQLPHYLFYCFYYIQRQKLRNTYPEIIGDWGLAWPNIELKKKSLSLKDAIENQKPIYTRLCQYAPTTQAETIKTPNKKVELLTRQYYVHKLISTQYDFPEPQLQPAFVLASTHTAFPGILR